jgi:hypothetical protein
MDLVQTPGATRPDRARHTGSMTGIRAEVRCKRCGAIIELEIPLGMLRAHTGRHACPGRELVGITELVAHEPL